MKFVLIPSYLPSVLNFRGKLLQAIAAQGYDIYILAPDLASYAKDCEILRKLGYHLYEIPMQRAGTNPMADAKTFVAIYQWLKTIKPDYVLGYTIKPVIYGTLAALLARVPHRFAMITGLGYAFQVNEGQQPSKTQRLIYELYKQSLKWCEKVFFQNPDDLALFRQLNLLSKSTQTALINGSGVDLSQYQVVDLPTDDAHEVKVSFLLIARLLKDKGIREYIAAAKIIKERFPTVAFHLVGWLDENPNAITQSELDDWIAQGIIKYWGKLDDIRPAMAQCSVYVLPSYREGTPRTVLEAMAMGRAIITTNAPGCKETVIDGYNGYLVDVKSSDQLVAAMEKFITDKTLITKMGKHSRDLVVEKFDVNKVNAKMLAEMKMS